MEKLIVRKNILELGLHYKLLSICKLIQIAYKLNY